MSTTLQLNKGEGRKLPKPNNIVAVPTSIETDFFKRWCVFLRPFINLTDREIDVIASYLKQRWHLSKYISDPSILDTMLMGEDTKKKVVEECNMTLQYYYVIMSSLKAKKAILGNSINPRLIPNIRPDDNGCFQLLVLFKDTGKKE